MPRRQLDLFGQIATFPALRRAAMKALLSKRKKPGAAAFAVNLERELLRLERELQDSRYRPGAYVEIEVFDPKHRIVSAAPFRDRVVHHALMAVVGPLFEAGFIDHSFANRVAKGTHRGIEAYERYRDRHAFVLRCDVFRFFPSIDHEVLKRDFRRRIACPRTLALLDRIVDGSNAQEPVNLHFPGDDLFTPYMRRRGRRSATSPASGSPTSVSTRWIISRPSAWARPISAMSMTSRCSLTAASSWRRGRSRSRRSSCSGG